MPLTGPLNDVLALDSVRARGDLEWRHQWIWQSYLETGLVKGAFVQVRLELDGTRTGEREWNAEFSRFLRQVRTWERAGEIAAFLQAAREAEAGRWPSAIASHLDRVTFPVAEGFSVVEPADLLALAAWSLDQLIHAKGVAVHECEFCGAPWITSAGREGRYCPRPAPGEWTRGSCRDIAKVRDYRARASKRKAGTDGKRR
jgi:hypothetical protein